MCFISEVDFVLVKSYSISPICLQHIMKKSFVPTFVRYLMITYLITLSLEKKKYRNCFGQKKSGRNFECCTLYAKICENPAFDLKAFFKIFKFFYMINEKLVMLIYHITVSFQVSLNKCNCYCYNLLSPFPHVRLVLVSYIIRVDAELTWTML